MSDRIQIHLSLTGPTAEEFVTVAHRYGISHLYMARVMIRDWLDLRDIGKVSREIGWGINGKEGKDAKELPGE